MHFLSQFLNSTVRTEDPEEAHLFYLPTFTYAYTRDWVGTYGVGSSREHRDQRLQRTLRRHRGPRPPLCGGVPAAANAEQRVTGLYLPPRLCARHTSKAVGCCSPMCLQG